MKIKVTQEDIDKGVKSDCFACPVARAMSRVFGKKVFVGKLSCEVQDGMPIPNGKEVMHFLSYFDDGFPMEPFSFHLSAEYFILRTKA